MTLLLACVFQNEAWSHESVCITLETEFGGFGVIYPVLWSVSGCQASLCSCIWIWKSHGRLSFVSSCWACSIITASALLFPAVRVSQCQPPLFFRPAVPSRTCEEFVRNTLAAWYLTQAEYFMIKLHHMSKTAAVLNMWVHVFSIPANKTLFY